MFYFISYFIAIKRMASAPLESMKDGGMLWFVDLTSSDPTWLLSACCSSSLFLAIKTGLDIPMNNMGQTVRTIFNYGLPALVFFSTHYFPSFI
uniref:PIN-like protein n=1 Tax=Romanomermis culicivorax TaxID=13658 RepID=A0A915KFU0_ROMCU